MIREEKIKKMTTLAEFNGFLGFEEDIKTSKGEGDIILKDGLYKEIEGDWCLISEWKQMTDEDIDIVFVKMQEFAQRILDLA